MSQDCVIAFGCRKKKKLKFYSAKLMAIISQWMNQVNTKDKKKIVLLTKIIVAGHSSVLFGCSWTEVSVLSSQVFEQASKESCGWQNTHPDGTPQLIIQFQLMYRIIHANEASDLKFANKDTEMIL